MQLEEAMRRIVSHVRPSDTWLLGSSPFLTLYSRPSSSSAIGILMPLGVAAVYSVMSVLMAMFETWRLWWLRYGVFLARLNVDSSDGSRVRVSLCVSAIE